MIPPSLTALGKKSLPASIERQGKAYELRRVFKNDFFAVTALYAHDDEKVLLKVGRQASFLCVPLAWVGRFLARREEHALKMLAEVEGVPTFFDRWEGTGIIREFVEGHAMAKGERVPDDFHAQLGALVEAIHAHRMAYVDLEKCENVLVGDDGCPHLFDFQIAWFLSARWGGELWPMRRLRRWFQNGDRYHLVKLQRRTRPDQLSDEQLAASYRKPWYVRVHRFLTWPFTYVRRVILHRIDPRRGPGERGRMS